jgi:multiple sugar transport system permease protein
MLYVGLSILGIVLLADSLGVDIAAGTALVVSLLLLTIDVPRWTRFPLLTALYLSTIVLIGLILGIEVAAASIALSIGLFASGLDSLPREAVVGSYFVNFGLIYLIAALLLGWQGGLAVGALAGGLYVVSLRLPHLYANIFYAIIALMLLGLMVSVVGITSTLIVLVSMALLLFYRPLKNQFGLLLHVLVSAGVIYFSLTVIADIELIESKVVGGIVGAVLCLVLISPGGLFRENFWGARRLANIEFRAWQVYAFYALVCLLIMGGSLTVVTDQIGNQVFGGSIGLILCAIFLQLVPSPRGASWDRGVISNLELESWQGRVIYRLIMISLLLLSVTVIFPFLFTFTSGLKNPIEIRIAGLTLWPEEPAWDNYELVWEKFDFIWLFQNTFLIVTLSVFIQIGISTITAYSLSRLKPVGGRFIMMGFLVTLMIPGIAYLVPLYVTAFELDLVGSYWGIWLPAGVNAFMIFVLKSFFDNLPSELFDAARVDGANSLQILWRIALPLSRPIILVFAILTFVNFWKDFLWPYLILLSEPNERYTIAVYLYELAERQNPAPLNQQMAAYFIGMLPPLLIAIFLQRYIRQGISVGGVKG